MPGDMGPADVVTRPPPPPPAGNRPRRGRCDQRHREQAKGHRHDGRRAVPPAPAAPVGAVFFSLLRPTLLPAGEAAVGTGPPGARKPVTELVPPGVLASGIE